MRRAVPALVLLALASVGCGRSPMGTEVDAAGQRVRMDCVGTVGPAVVFVHGMGERASSASFQGVRARLDRHRRTCRYDRPGAGDSPPPTRTGRDATDLDRELAAVVDRADPDRPVVLVGHSFGSYPVLYFAATRPDRVRGVVVLDGVDPRVGLVRALEVDSYREVPMGAEALDLPAVQRQTAAAVDTLADLPLLVLEGELAGPEQVRAQQRIAALSTAGRLVRVADSGPEVPTDAPDTVAEAIRTVSAAP